MTSGSLFNHHSILSCTLPLWNTCRQNSVDKQIDRMRADGGTQDVVIKQLHCDRKKQLKKWENKWTKCNGTFSYLTKCTQVCFLATVVTITYCTVRLERFFKCIYIRISSILLSRHLESHTALTSRVCKKLSAALAWEKHEAGLLIALRYVTFGFLFCVSGEVGQVAALRIASSL
jgi:hypothetical protein